MTFAERLRNFLKSLNLPALPSEARTPAWDKAVNEFTDLERPLAKPRVTKKTPISKMTDDQFLDYLKTEPSLAGIDIERERGKCAFWCKNKGFQMTRMRLVNWLGKADKTLTNHGRDSSTRAADANERSVAPPHGWRAWAEARNRSLLEAEGAENGVAAYAVMQNNFFLLPKSWRDECRKDMAWDDGQSGPVAL